jgi:hypothetical protein
LNFFHTHRDRKIFFCSANGNKKAKITMGPDFFPQRPQFFPPNWLENSVALIDTIFRIALIDTFLRMDGNCIASSVKLLYLGILYRFIGAGKFFCWFFLSLHQ